MCSAYARTCRRGKIFRFKAAGRWKNGQIAWMSVDQGLEEYREMVLQTDWDEEQKPFLTEDLYEPLEDLRWELEYLSFEAGFCAGVKVAGILHL